MTGEDQNINGTCGTCKHSKRSNFDFNVWCRRHAPIATHGPDKYEAKWPIVVIDDSCGDYERGKVGAK